MLELTEAETARFLKRLGHPTECWVWPGPKNNRGYGRFSIYRNGKRIRLLTHRLAFKLATGIDPAGMVVRHDCDNPPCCNPAHLRLGSQADNVRDAVERRRADPAGLNRGRQLLQDSLSRALTLQEKLCPACVTVKPLDDFHRARSQPDGRQGWCKVCRSQKLRDAWRNDPEFREKELARKRRRQGKDALNEDERVSERRKRLRRVNAA